MQSRCTVACLAVVLSLLPSGLVAQAPPGEQGSRNLTVRAHVPLGGAQRVAGIEIEQELARPFAYVSMRLTPAGFQVLHLKTPDKPQVLYRWQIENAEAHQGPGAGAPVYAKTLGRYYLAQSFQFERGGPDADLGAIIFDVTGLPDTSTIREIARLRVPQFPGGFRSLFAYKHSTGLALVFATTTGPVAQVYDLDRIVANDPRQGLIATIPIPVDSARADAADGDFQRGYQSVFVGYDPATRQDKLYGAGAGGYYVYDVTELLRPRLLTSLTGVPGVTWGQWLQPTPDGQYLMAQTDYRYGVTRMFDLKAGLNGQTTNVSRPIGAWTANWKGLPAYTEVRWPYAFVTHHEQGMHVVNLMDPTNPYTVAYYDTFDGPDGKRLEGAVGVDVRNADGLIVVSDQTTGFWTLKLEGFDGWNGHQWGMPNMSSAQDWDNGPDGAPKPQKVS